MPAGKPIFLAALLLVPALGAAESATEALRARDAEIRAALPPKGQDLSPDVRARLEDIVRKTVDVRGMVEAAMAESWGKATDAQRKRVEAAFEKRFSRLSGDQLERYRSSAIAYGSEVDAGGGAVRVATKVDVMGEPTEIAYAMRRQKDVWRIEDVLVDGSSTVADYRASFAKTIAKDGIDGLIRRLESAGAKKGGAKGGEAAEPGEKPSKKARPATP